jgi:hypothetical protein
MDNMAEPSLRMRCGLFFWPTEASSEDQQLLINELPCLDMQFQNNTHHALPVNTAAPLIQVSRL